MISAVIATTPDRADLLVGALYNLSVQSHPPVEVVVVTDAGQQKRILDAIPAELYNTLDLRVIESDGYGLSRARNYGVKTTEGNIVLFIDDDVVIADRNILLRVEEAFEENESLGVYGIQVKPLFYNSIRLPDRYNWIFGCTDDNAVRPVGAFFAVRRECFDTVGLFNEDLGRRNGSLVSGEETEFMNRVAMAGYDVVLDSRYEVYHIVRDRKWGYVLKRAFYEGISKARFRNYDYSAERAYLFRYMRDPLGWIVAGTTVLGFVLGKLGRW